MSMLHTALLFDPPRANPFVAVCIANLALSNPQKSGGTLCRVSAGPARPSQYIVSQPLSHTVLFFPFHASPAMPTTLPSMVCAVLIGASLPAAQSASIADPMIHRMCTDGDSPVDWR